MAISDEDWGEFKGAMESHVKRVDDDRKDAKDFREKMYQKWDDVNKKAEKAHFRIDKHEVRVSTLKYVAGLISASMAALISWCMGGK